MNGSTPAFSLQGVTKRFGQVVAVNDVWLDIEEGEFFSLLGPSGCGKTTTLRMLAGFEEPDEGVIMLRDDDVTFTPPNKRNVNLVFQHYELFPHMTVFENVAYGLRLRKVKDPELTQRVHEALAIVRVEELEQRGAKQLSGGQQQRVALARAIVNRPAALLLDEPLSALDVKLRKQMQLELKSIQHKLGTTFVYVTHDQEEALLMSDRIGVMEGGNLLQVATPREIYEHPADDFVADFIGSLDVFGGVVSRVEGDVAIATPEGAGTEGAGTEGAGTEGAGTEGAGTDAAANRRARLTFTASDAIVGSRVRVAVRPERVSLHPTAPDELDRLPPHIEPTDSALPGRIEEVVYAGSLTRYLVSVPGQPRVTCERTSDGSLRDLTERSTVWLSWPPDAAFVLPGTGEPTPAATTIEEGQED